MKFSNTNAVKTRLTLLIFLIALSLAFLLTGIILSKPLVFLTGIFSSCIFLSFFSVMKDSFKCFELENSGEVISIRSYYPTIKPKINLIEFPKAKLLGFEIRYVLHIPTLKLTIFSERKSKVNLYFSLVGFQKSSISKLQSSLDNKQSY